MEYDKVNLKDKLKKYINDNPDQFPFAAKFWEIKVEKIEEINIKNNIEYGTYETNSNDLIPFYKTYSKIIQLTEIN